MPSCNSIEYNRIETKDRLHSLLLLTEFHAIQRSSDNSIGYIILRKVACPGVYESRDKLLLNVIDQTVFIPRVLPGHRGPIRRLKFAPGKGNMKLMVLFADGIDIWETQDVTISSIISNYFILWS